MSFYEWYLSRMKINWSQVAKREDFSCFFFSRQWKEFVILNKEFILKFTTITLSLLMRVSPWFSVNVLCLWPRKLFLVKFPLEINGHEHFPYMLLITHSLFRKYGHVLLFISVYSRELVGYFRVLLYPCFKTSLNPKPFLSKDFCMQFHFHANQSHFHENGFALRLALKQRQKGTRKWPLSLKVLFSWFPYSKPH